MKCSETSFTCLLSKVSSIDPYQRRLLTLIDNPVNQQIALKFIRSLKFSVNAVWNGKEALEYLLKATDPDISPEDATRYPVPSLVLMDCQMPVLDGYHTTHVLRHHSPYKSMEILRRMPIVAMTASAIQGDREKCERAGMDDYLAKPVKRPVLEKMILKWINGTSPTRPAMPKPTTSDNSIGSGGSLKPMLSRTGTDHSSTCAEMDEIANEILRSRTPVDTRHKQQQAPSQRPGLISSIPSAQQQRRSSLSRSIFASGMIGGESEAERGLRRAEAEEKATSLRDAKLLAASQYNLETGSPLPLAPPPENYNLQSPPHGDVVSDLIANSNNGPLLLSYPEQGRSDAAEGVMALTEENVERLNRDHGAIPSPGSVVQAHTTAEMTDGYFSKHLAHASLAVEKVSNDATTPGNTGEIHHASIPNIPGPPPEMVSPIRDGAEFLKLKGERVAAGFSSMGNVPRNSNVETGPIARPKLPVSKRGQAQVRSDGQSIIRERKTSDWSNSEGTVKPDK